MTSGSGFVDLSVEGTVAMLEHEVTDRRAWTRDTVSARDWTVPLSPRAVAEIDALAETLSRQPMPTLVLSPEQFALPECRAAMARTKAILKDGIGVALVDRLPIDRLTAAHATAAHWVLGQCVGLPVAQKWDGTMIYDVTDTGKRAAYGLRGSWTNLELSFH